MIIISTVFILLHFSLACCPFICKCTLHLHTQQTYSDASMRHCFFFKNRSFVSLDSDLTLIRELCYMRRHSPLRHCATEQSTTTCTRLSYRSKICTQSSHWYHQQQQASKEGTLSKLGATRSFGTYSCQTSNLL